jgi:hypothetical protein
MMKDLIEGTHTVKHEILQIWNRLITFHTVEQTSANIIDHILYRKQLLKQVSLLHVISVYLFDQHCEHIPFLVELLKLIHNIFTMVYPTEQLTVINELTNWDRLMDGVEYLRDHVNAEIRLHAEKIITIVENLNTE